MVQKRSADRHLCLSTRLDQKNSTAGGGFPGDKQPDVIKQEALDAAVARHETGNSSQMRVYCSKTCPSHTGPLTQLGCDGLKLFHRYIFRSSEPMMSCARGSTYGHRRPPHPSEFRFSPSTNYGQHALLCILDNFLFPVQNVGY